MRDPVIRGFPYVLLVRAPLVADLIWVSLLIWRAGRENSTAAFNHGSSPFELAMSGGALFVLAGSLMQLLVVPIAIRASWRAHTLRSWQPNLAIACGCLQIALLIWMATSVRSVH